jgi:hypothetical protein
MLRRTMTKALGIALFAWLALAGCGDLDKAIEDKANEVMGNKPEETAPPAETAPVVPAPAPTPVPAEPAPEPTPTPEPEVVPPPAPEPAKPVEPAKPIAEKPKAVEPEKPAAPKPSTTKPLEIAKPVAPAPVKPPIVEPKPAPKPVEVAKPVEPEPAKPATKVTLPKLKHLKVSMPARVQELLNADTRMQPWLNSTLATIEKCYEGVLASSPSAAGTIKFVLEMHENARPDADITALPPQLSGVVACGTGKLMRAGRMPLFTGKEGEKHTVSVKFTP